MKILTVDQIRQADQATIANEPIASIDLMERAANAFSIKFMQWFSQGDFSSEQPVQLFCGIGNNGGDGLAIARILLKYGYPVAIYSINPGKKFSEDFQINYDRLTAIQPVHTIEDGTSIPPIKSEGIIIDAIFGSGLSRPAEGIFAQVIDAINQAPCPVIAVDISSGLFADKPVMENTPGDDEKNKPAIIESDYTFSFQLPKLAFMVPQNEIYVGAWYTLHIGLDRHFIENAPSPYFYPEQKEIAPLLNTRRKFAHKGDFGKILIIAGGYGKMGAAVLCLKAAMRSGSGLVTAHIPGCGYSIVQSTIPEVMVKVDENEYFFTDLEPGENKEEISKALRYYDAIGIGPGLGTGEATIKALSALLNHLNDMANPPRLVLDADALNICSQDEALIKAIPKGAVLTPHPGEFARLAGKSNHDFHRLELLRKFAVDNEVYVVLKGGNTAIGTPEGNIYFNSSGNPGMATGGSGDTLTGIITGLLGQKYEILNALLIGVYLHGLSGDFSAKNLGEEGLIASDIIENLPYAFKNMHHLLK